MCGLFGFKTAQGVNLSQDQRTIRAKALTMLALEMENRGDKSTGLANVYGNQTKLLKRACAAREFIRLPEYGSAVMHSSVSMGHTRFPTIGATTDANAHPFRSGNIVGAHNGSVTNYWSIDNSVDVDSEVIFKLLAKHNNQYAVAFAQLIGTFAITWMDVRKPEVLYMVTHGNPLFWIVSPKLQTMFWSSEELPLTVIKTVLLKEGEDVEIWYPLDDKVLSFQPDLQYTAVDVKFKTYQTSTPYNHYGKQNALAPGYGEDAEEYDFDREYVKKEEQKMPGKGNKKKRPRFALQPLRKTDVVTSFRRLPPLLSEVAKKENICLSGENGRRLVWFCDLCDEKIYLNSMLHYKSTQCESTYCAQCGRQLVEENKIQHLYPVYPGNALEPQQSLPLA